MTAGTEQGMQQVIEQAYADCEQITRREARNFYYGIRLLPPPKRAALSAVYALARRIDDIGDGDLPETDKLAALSEVRAGLADPSGKASADPVLAAVHDAARRYPLDLGAFGELVDGVEMDVTGRRYATFDDLVAYCTCVAGSVGRLSLAIFSAAPAAPASDPVAIRYANTLGVALQQTNILRDVREDLMLGRVYLPQDELDHHGVELRLDAAGRLVDEEGALTRLVRAAAARAYGWYDEGLRLLPLLDRRSAACCGAMAGIYRDLLRRIEAQPSLTFDRRLSLTGREKARVAVRALAGRTR